MASQSSPIPSDRDRLRASVIHAWWLAPDASSANIAKQTGCGIAAANIFKPKDLARAIPLNPEARLKNAIGEVWKTLGDVSPGIVSTVTGCTETVVRKYHPTNPVDEPAQIDPYELLHQAIADAWNSIEDPTAYKVADAVGCTPHIALKWKPRRIKKAKPLSKEAPPADEPRQGTKTADIVAFLRSGVSASVREISEKFEVDRAQVYQIIKRWEPEWKPNKTRTDQREEPQAGTKTAEIVAAIKSGVVASVRELSVKFGIERTQIYQIMRRWTPDWKPVRAKPGPKAGAKPGPKAAAKVVGGKTRGRKSKVRFFAAVTEPQMPGKRKAESKGDTPEKPERKSAKEGAPSKTKGKVKPSGRRPRSPSSQPREGSITKSIVDDWNAGRIRSANEAARRYQVKWNTAAKALLRWTDYDGQPRE